MLSLDEMNRFQKALKEYEFEIEIVNDDQFIDVDLTGPMYCGDGRLIARGKKKKEAARSPKIFGGTLGVAVLVAYRNGRSEVRQSDILEAKSLIEEAGYTPGIHDLSGHEEWGKVHCGFGGLVGRGELDDLRFAKKVTIDWVVEQLGKENEVELAGEHQEQETVINLSKVDKTLEPDGSRFILDPWVLEKMGFSKEEIDWSLWLSIMTIVGLNGPRKIVIVR